MRRAAWIVIPMVLFLAYWGARKVSPFLHTRAAEVYATPTGVPTDAGALALVQVPGKGGRACVDHIEYGPGARYVELTINTPKRPAGAFTVEAQAPGYRATARQRPGLGTDQQAILPIRPATRSVGDGTLCITNEGRHRVGFYGVNPGRGSTPARSTVDGRAIVPQLSVRLLTSPSRSLGSRLGTILDHAAAFRPVTGWELWLLLVLVAVGVPVAIAVALIRADAEDDEVAPAD
jgi:hypothetical protein